MVRAYLCGEVTVGKSEAEILRARNKNTTECIGWPYGRDAFGYARAKVSWSSTRLAHRAMCELVHGPAPSKKHQALHKCGMGKNGCINPNHLAWGTQAENIVDAKKHGSIRRGSKSARSVLTETQIPEIRSKYASGMSQRSIALEYNVCSGTIQAIVEGRTWLHA
jgi:hypothetical protein